MTQLSRGANAPVSASRLSLSVRGARPGAVDLMAFQVTADRKVRSDADLVFFNQPASPEGAVRLTAPDALEVDLTTVPDAIETVAVTVALDEGQPGALSDIPGLAVTLLPDGIEVPAAGLTTERAAILAEVYRRAGAWKVRSVSAGWTEGLAALLREHGVQVDDEPPAAESAAAAPSPPAAAPPPPAAPSAPPPATAGPWVPATGAPPPPPAPNGPLAWAPGTPPASGGPSAWPPAAPQPPSPPSPSGGWATPAPSAPSVPTPTPPRGSVFPTAPPTAAPAGPPSVFPSGPGAAPASTPGSAPDPAAGPRSVPGEERLSLQKRQTLNLRKEQVHRVLLTKGAAGERARVVLVIDKTGSMSGEFSSGLVHRVVERMVPIATQIDTDGTLETYLYATKFARLPDLRVGDMEAWTAEFLHMGGTHGGINYRKLGAVNDEIPILTELTGTARRGDPPTLVLFFTDGGFSKKREITRIMKDAAGLPIFWEFVGLGANNYGLLEKLDDMSGREVDNVDFFAVDDIDRVDDAELYRRLLTEFPGWLTAARARGIVAPR